jgi:cytochrome c
MDSFELNKILGAFLGTCLVLMVLNMSASALFAPAKLAKPGYEIAVPEQQAQAGQGPAAAEEPIEKLLAAATVDRGESAAKKCASCHTFAKGEPNRIGPNLYGVIGRPKASSPGFNYSAALKAKGGDWTPEELNAFLRNPKAAVPGTAMNFAGVSRGSERADLITFLHSRADNPAPLPKAAQADAPKAQ